MLLEAPRLCLTVLKDGNVLSGQGSRIESDSFKINVFQEEGSLVKQVIELDDCLLVCGDKHIAAVPQEKRKLSTLPTNFTRKLDDFILTIHAIDDNQIAVLLCSNVLVIYKYTISQEQLEIDEVDRILCDHLATMLHGLIIGYHESDLQVISGNVFGEIFIWNSGQKGKIQKTCRGHTGMIFGLLLDGNMLYSISDDRSLRVWNIDGDDGEVKEVSCQFGHSARPFAITKDDEGCIYTSGLDQTILKWRFSTEEGLQLICRQELNIGGIRSLTYVNSCIYAGSENGGIVSIKANTLDSREKLTIIETCESLRGFGYLEDNLLCSVNDKGSLLVDNVEQEKDISWRFVQSAEFQRRQVKLVSIHGPDHVRLFKSVNGKVTTKNLQSQDKILATFPMEEYIFLYNVNKLALFFTHAGVFKYAFSTQQLHDTSGRKANFVPTSACVSYDILPERHMVAIGTSCGHFLYALIDTTKGKSGPPIQLRSCSVISNLCARNEIVKIMFQNQTFVVFCKSGSISRWIFTEEDVATQCFTPFVPFLSSFDWPCGVYEIGNRKFVAQFSSIMFQLFDMITGFKVLDIECGGGNRSWSFKLDSTSDGSIVGSLFFIKQEKLIKITKQLVETTVYKHSMHTSQIVGMDLLTTQKSSFLVTIGLDCKMTLSKLVDDSSDLKIICKIHRADGETAIHALPTTSSSLESHNLLVSGSSKGDLSVWSTSDLDSDDPLITRTCYNAHDVCARILSIRSFKSSEENTIVAAVYSDGVIKAFNLVTGDESKHRSLVLELVSIIRITSYALFTDIALTKEHLIAVSTEGNVEVYGIGKESTGSLKTKIVECGISAVSHVISIAEQSFMVLGDESGQLSIISWSSLDQKVKIVGRVDYHCSTVTAIVAIKSRISSSLLICSTSLDSRVVWHRFDPDNRKITFLNSQSLSIWDPSAIILHRNNVLTVGSGYQCQTSFIDLQSC